MDRRVRYITIRRDTMIPSNSSEYSIMRSDGERKANQNQNLNRGSKRRALCSGDEQLCKGRPDEDVAFKLRSGLVSCLPPLVLFQTRFLSPLPIECFA